MHNYLLLDPESGSADRFLKVDTDSHETNGDHCIICWSVIYFNSLLLPALLICFILFVFGSNVDSTGTLRVRSHYVPVRISIRDPH